MTQTFRRTLIAAFLAVATAVGVCLAMVAPGAAQRAYAEDQLPAPTNIQCDSLFRWSWDQVMYAGSYTVNLYKDDGTYVAGPFVLDSGQNKWECSRYFTELGGYYITVQAGASFGHKASEIVKSDPVFLGAASWRRLWGNTALDTMEAIIDEGKWETGGAVVLVTAGGYWDALTAAGLAGLEGAPIIMTDTNVLSAQAMNQLVKLKPSLIYVCGGTAAVSDDVVAEVEKATGLTVNKEIFRLYGEDAVGTANLIYTGASKLSSSSWTNGVAFVCTSDGYWDALAVAPISYAMKIPIFLTYGHDTISEETLKIMNDAGIQEVYIIGGEAAVSKDVENAINSYSESMHVADRLWGADALATSEAVAEFGTVMFGMSEDKMGLATNGGYYDALAGAPLCGRNNAVLVLVGDKDSSTLSSFVKMHGTAITFGYVFGGEAAIDEGTYAQAINSLPAKG